MSGISRYLARISVTDPIPLSYPRTEHPERTPDFERINHYMDTEQKSEEIWGTRRYRTSERLMLNADDGLVGILKEKRREGNHAAEEAIEILMSLEGIRECTIAAGYSGYRAVLKGSLGTTISVDYFREGQNYIIQRYKNNHFKNEAAKRRAEKLDAEQPKPDEDGWRNGSTTEDIGLVVYGNKPIIATLRHGRRKKCQYHCPEQRVYETVEGVEQFVRETLARSLVQSFPGKKEIERIEAGDQIEFSILFGGYMHTDEEQRWRDTRLKKAYGLAVIRGIKGILNNITRTNSTQKEETGIELTPDEWFREVFMKAEGIETVVFKRDVDARTDHFFKYRTRGKKQRYEKTIEIEHTVVHPTFEGMDSAYESALEAKRRRVYEETEGKERIASK